MCPLPGGANTPPGIVTSVCASLSTSSDHCGCAHCFAGRGWGGRGRGRGRGRPEGCDRAHVLAETLACCHEEVRFQKRFKEHILSPLGPCSKCFNKVPAGASCVDGKVKCPPNSELGMSRCLPCARPGAHAAADWAGASVPRARRGGAVSSPLLNLHPLPSIPITQTPTTATDGAPTSRPTTTAAAGARPAPPPWPPAPPASTAPPSPAPRWTSATTGSARA